MQSRYYDPEIGRFINIDSPSNLGEDGILFNNLFTYCGNNPVMGYDPTGCWDWGIFSDIAVTIGSALVSISVGINTVVTTFWNTGSVRKAYSAGVVAATTTFGVINNTVNAVYYNCLSDGKSDIETDSLKSSYVDSYVTRWDRLDYTKQETQEETYNSNAWRYHSEYSLHMYGWYATGWTKDKDIPVLSGYATSFYTATVHPQEWDERPLVKIGTFFWGIFGL